MPATDGSAGGDAGWDGEVDVLVVGAGGCGLAAAVAAHDAGASTAIVEKLDRPGGNTALSTGSIPGAGTRFQAAAGIEDSAERMVEDLLRQSGPHEAPGLTQLLARRSAALVEWLVDDVGVHLELITDYRHVGHSVPRLHAPASRRGADLVAGLVAAVERREIPMAFGNAVEALVVADGGGVAGAVIGGGRVAPHRLRAGAVVLATNGFAANRPLVRRYCPQMADAQYFGAVGSTGEAVTWGEQLGLALANMGAYQGYAAVAYPQGTLLSWTTIEKGGFLCDASGRRFGDEIVGYSGFAEDVLCHGGRAYAVFDTRVRDYAGAHEEEFRELCELGGVKERADTAELADVFGLPAGELAGTIDAFNEAAAGRCEDRFGRRDFGFAPLQPPYVIAQVVPGLFHTQGGLLVDDDAHVLGADGAAVAHLFAGGGAAAGVSGRSGGRGYSSGNGLLSALGLGWIAGGRAAAEAVKASRP